MPKGDYYDSSPEKTESEDDESDKKQGDNNMQTLANQIGQIENQQ